MNQEVSEVKAAVRYSEAYKLAVVREVEGGEVAIDVVRRKFGIGGGTVQKWLLKYGKGTRGKVIRVQKPEEIDELKRLKERVRRPHTALGYQVPAAVHHQTGPAHPPSIQGTQTKPEVTT